MKKVLIAILVVSLVLNTYLFGIIRSYQNNDVENGMLEKAAETWLLDK